MHSRAGARVVWAAGGRRSARASVAARVCHLPARPVLPRRSGIPLAGQTMAAAVVAGAGAAGAPVAAAVHVVAVAGATLGEGGWAM